MLWMKDERSERDPKVVTESNPRVDSYTDNEDDESPSGADRVVTIVPPVNNQLVDLSSDEEGLLISIAPIISTESVLAEIDIALNTVTGYDELDRPIVTEQNLTNRFTLQDNEEILLGTLERESVVEARRGIPGLKDLPVLPFLFSVESRQTERSRLFILATPHYSNVGFEAKSIAELKSTSALRQAPRQINLEDGEVESSMDRVE